MKKDQQRPIEGEQLGAAMNAPRGGAILRRMFLTKSASPIASIWIMTTCRDRVSSQKYSSFVWGGRTLIAANTTLPFACWN